LFPPTAQRHDGVKKSARHYGTIAPARPGVRPEKLIMRRAFGFLAVLLILIEAGCAGTSPGKNPPAPPTQPPPPAQVSITINPTSANVRAAASQTFTAQLSDATNQNVTWAVSGVAGGNSTTGTITSSGAFTAPAALPNPNTVTVTVTSVQNSSVSASSVVTLWNPTPAISSVSPSTFTAGSFTLTIHGSQFVNGAQVLFGGSALTTTFVSSTQLTATGSEATAGSFGVSVSNPNPGSSASGSINETVTASGGNPPPPPPPPPPPASACSGISVGQGGSLNGFLPFPTDNLWNQNIASADVDPNSAAIINFIGGTDPVHPDFGSGQFDGSIIGIPYFVVGAQQAPVTINLTDFADESDPGPMPVPPAALVEGDPNPGDGDRHTLVVDNNSCWLYELYNAVPNNDGSWSAASTAVWDLQADGQRPLTWTSADAAGLSVFAGLARYDEVAAGEIKHALRVTLQNSRAAFVPPASHWAANSTNANAAPMGMRLRLKSTFNISGFSASNQVILKALQQYGLIMADNGSNMFISGAPDDRWDNDDLHNLDQVTAADFEVVKMGTVYTQANLPTGPAPSIASFTASASPVSAGTSVTLNWNVTGASYFIVTPQIGAIRGTSVVVNPTQTTTYTLDATNEFGRSTASVTITVQ
jgi:hypothetical protein